MRDDFAHVRRLEAEAAALIALADRQWWRPFRGRKHRARARWLRRLASYETSLIEVYRREERYRAGLPARMAAAEREINDQFAGVLPEGMRFEWGPR